MINHQLHVHGWTFCTPLCPQNPFLNWLITSINNQRDNGPHSRYLSEEQDINGQAYGTYILEASQFFNAELENHLSSYLELLKPSTLQPRAVSHVISVQMKLATSLPRHKTK